MFKNTRGPIEKLTVLYDASCGFCVSCRAWLETQPAFLPLEFLPARSAAAARLFPSLSGSDSADELIVVGSDGSIYRDSAAWIMCLYALREYREWAVRLSSAALRPLARQAFDLASHNRKRISQSLGLLPEEELVQRLRETPAPSCGKTTAALPPIPGRARRTVGAVILAALLLVLAFLTVESLPSIGYDFRETRSFTTDKPTEPTSQKEASMQYILWTYAVYLVISIALTAWVARTLHKNGRVFLVDTFAGSEPLADSVNHLLVVGFYLINIGYVALALKESHKPVDAAGSLELLSSKVGLVLLVLGGMHFFNLYVFSRLRRRALLRNMPPPVRPQGNVPPPLPPRLPTRPSLDNAAGAKA